MIHPTQHPKAPEGFKEIVGFGNFHELVGPIYHSLTQPGTVVGMWAQEKHRNGNSRPIMHGGLIATLIDTACTWAARQSSASAISTVTTNLSVNYVGSARPGDWMEVHVDVLKSGRRIIFLDCIVFCSGQRIAQASAQCLVIEKAGGS